MRIALTPPYTAAVPDYPYARGGHHLSNGKTWIDQLASRMQLGNSVGPALRNPGFFSNFAMDRTRSCTESFLPSYMNLSQQVKEYRDLFGPVVPNDALHVLFVGSNDVRDALIKLIDTLNPDEGAAEAENLVDCALVSVRTNLEDLIDAGARTFLVANVP